MAKIDEHVKVMMLKGETGSSIKSIDKTATDGLVDTYAVTLTDGRKSNFTVTNGRDGRDGADFDTFEIGGRNLARNSARLDITPSKGNLCVGEYGGANIEDRGDGLNEAKATAMWSGICVYANKLDANPGDTFTFSATFEASGNDLDVHFFAMVYNASGTREPTTLYIDSQRCDGDGKLLSTVKDGDSKRLSVLIEWTDKAKSLIDSGGSIKFTFQVGSDIVPGSGTSVSIYAPKLERGTKPSDWTPAPEDKADASALAKKADVSAIVPSAAVESSATASQAYAAGDYVVVNGALRKVKSAIAKGDAINDSNSTATTVTGEIATALDSASRTVRVKTVVPNGWHGELTVATDVDEGGSSGGETGRFAELRGYLWSYDASADPWSNAVHPPDAPGDTDTLWVKVPERLSWSGKVDTRVCAGLTMTQSSEGMGYDFFGTYRSDCFLASDGYAYISVGGKDRFVARPIGLLLNCKFYLR